MDLSYVHDFCTELTKQVGKRLIAAQHNNEIKVSAKGKNDPVSDLDIWAENVIGEEIRRNFPDQIILGEETAVDLQQSLPDILNSEYCWVIDPIDGTANFIAGIPFFGISIALLNKGIQQYGIIYDPSHDETFSASVNSVANLNNRKISVTDTSQLKDATVGTDFPPETHQNWEIYKKPFDEVMRCCHKLRVFGASTLGLCWVACGRLDAYFAFGLRPWDKAAGTLIVKQAGGECGCFAENKESMKLISKTQLAANNQVFSEILSLTAISDSAVR